MNKMVLLLSCPDKPGIVARLAGFLAGQGANIMDLDEHVDASAGLFYVRIVYVLTETGASRGEIDAEFRDIARDLDADWRIDSLSRKIPAAVFVSKTDHCLQELLWRYDRGEFALDIRCVIANHEDLRPLVQDKGIPFQVFPLSPENRSDMETAELEFLADLGVESIILARYMQILSPEFVRKYPGNIINIHHSFLPAFKGGNPYRQAFERGVKIIGATSHYVTDDLDEGPIITQDVLSVSHRDALNDLMHKGRDLERTVLARAVKNHCERRILISGRKTVIFS